MYAQRKQTELQSETPIPVVAIDPVIPDKTIFMAICMKEGSGKIDHNAFNEEENAIGPAQIRPCYLEDANEWLMRSRKTPYAHKQMYDYRCAFAVWQAYNERYGFVTPEEKVRGHCGGPDGPWEPETLDHWQRTKKYFRHL